MPLMQRVIKLSGSILSMTSRKSPMGPSQVLAVFQNIANFRADGGFVPTLFEQTPKAPDEAVIDAEALDIVANAILLINHASTNDRRIAVVQHGAAIGREGLPTNNRWLFTFHFLSNHASPGTQLIRPFAASACLAESWNILQSIIIVRRKAV